MRLLSIFGSLVVAASSMSLHVAHADPAGHSHSGYSTCQTPFAPVCGSNGTSYYNRCHAALAKVSVVRNMPCMSTMLPQQPPKVISRIVEPPIVISLSQEVPTPTPAPTPEPTPQPEPTPAPPASDCDYGPACGVDGYTYHNACDAAAGNIAIQHKGTCQGSIGIGLVVPEPPAPQRLPEPTPEPVLEPLPEPQPAPEPDVVSYGEFVDGLPNGPVDEDTLSPIEVFVGGEVCHCDEAAPAPKPKPVHKHRHKHEIVHSHAHGTGHHHSGCRPTTKAVKKPASKPVAKPTPKAPVVKPVVKAPAKPPALDGVICGTDGHTYRNATDAAAGGISMKHQGPCKTSVKIVHGKIWATPSKLPLLPSCPDVYEPVCGVDGYTYQTSCDAVANKIKINYAGQCKPAAPAKTSVTLPVQKAKPPFCDTKPQHRCHKCKKPRHGNVIGRKVLGGVNFARSSSELNLAARKDLQAFARGLMGRYIGKIKIVGHTDNRGKEHLNRKLSKNRAREVANYLTLLSLPPQKMVIRGKGSKRPIADNKTKAGRAKNRRVELTVYGRAAHKH